MSEDPKIEDEMQRMPDEPLLPIEKRLIAWSLISGVLLLGLLIWCSAKFFPG
jgi:hypothetical protein